MRIREIARTGGYAAGMTGHREHDADAALWRSVFISMIHVLNSVEAEVKSAQDLTLLDLGVLFALGHAEQGRPMGQIAAIFGVDPSVITYRVKRMEAMGCVARTRSSTDRRLTHAVCTDTGRSRLRQARPVMLDSAHRHFLSALTPDNRPAVTDLFAALLAGQQQGHAGPGVSLIGG